MGYSYTDEELCQKAQHRDEQAWIELDRRYRRLTFGWCMYRLKDHNEAEECSSETMLRIHTRLLKFDPLRGKFRNWAWTICRDVLVDRLRRLKVMPLTSIESVTETLADPRPGPPSRYRHRLTTQVLESELARMPEKIRLALELVRQGSSIRAAARSARMHEHTLRYHLKRLILRVRALLFHLGIDPGSDRN